jgi:DNA-binding GntR family transcriptional regulator
MRDSAHDVVEALPADLGTTIQEPCKEVFVSTVGERLVSQDDVVRTITDAILAGDLAPGQRLVEADLAQSLGASRAAVRSALIDLTHEGLVERIANRGARVRIVPVEEALQITEVRAALEGLCAAKAAEHVTDEEITSLREIGREMKASVNAGEVVRYSHLNQKLHDRVIALSRQAIAAEVLGRLRARNVRHQFRLAFRPGRPQLSLPHHLAIIDAICRRDPRAAEAAMKAHLASVLAALADSPPTGPLG